MARLGIGLIGSGFMGRSHALAFRSVAGVFEPELVPDLELLADVDQPTAEAAAAEPRAASRSVSHDVLPQGAPAG